MTYITLEALSIFVNYVKKVQNIPVTQSRVDVIKCDLVFYTKILNLNTKILKDPKSNKKNPARLLLSYRES